jgi:hydroxymethylglutaryl-CoA lyase
MLGLQTAIELNVKEVAIFIAASESFSQKNINCSISESIERYKPVIEKSLQHGIKVRGYLSTVCGCPYEGDISEERVANLSELLYKLGCYEISLGDTIVWKKKLKIFRELELQEKFGKC